MQREVGPEEGVFSAAAADAPGRPHEGDLEVHDDSPQLRMHCTLARQRCRSLLLAQYMAALSVEDPIRMAWTTGAVDPVSRHYRSLIPAVPTWSSPPPSASTLAS